MAVKKLGLPTPWGNQPDDPADDPLSYALSEVCDHEDCFAGYDRRPPVPCLLGERAECAWGVRSREHFYCLWRLLELEPGTIHHPTALAKLLGVSKQRAQTLLAAAFTEARCQAEHMKPHIDES